jgi:hypothetical protein
MSGSIFSANTIAGLPVIEAFSDNKVTLGPYSSPVIVDSSGNISGSSSSTGSFGFAEVAGNIVVGGEAHTSNNWISIYAKDGDDLTGGGITFYETDSGGVYSENSPPYGAKIVYNEDSDYFKIGTMAVNRYKSQINMPRNSDQVRFSGSAMSAVDDTWDLGHTNFHWDDIYATNGTILTSDRNYKIQISGSNLGLSFINQLIPVSYQFVSGSSGRTHYGLIAQDIEEVLNTNNMPSRSFAGFIKSTHASDDTGEMVALDTPKYGLRYTEFIAPLIKSVQELSSEINFLKAAITGSDDLDELKALIQ